MARAVTRSDREGKPSEGVAYAGRTKSDMTGGEAVIRALEVHGVEHVFGIPGTHTLPIDRYLAGSSIRHMQPRHEQGAGFAADGYARASGRPGVCIVTSGPGVTNLATAAAQACSDPVFAAPATCTRRRISRRRWTTWFESDGPTLIEAAL